MPVSFNSRSAVETATQEQEFQTVNLAFLGSMLPGIIHNLSTPLSGVLGATQLLEMRVAAVKDLIQNSDDIDTSLREELEKNLNKNETNIDIISRNAKYLSDIIHTIVQRINRGSLDRREAYPLNDLLKSELKFLDADLVFKHKVKKNIILSEITPVAPMVYGHVASVIDEFISMSISVHDFKVGVMEMDFTTVCDSATVGLRMAARPTRQPDTQLKASMITDHIGRLKEDGWLVSFDDFEKGLSLELVWVKQQQST